jgi:hypothetical protein
MEWIVGAAVAAVAALVAGLWLKQRGEAAAAMRRLNEDNEAAQFEQQLAASRQEAADRNSATPLIAAPNDELAEEVKALGGRIEALLAEFDSVVTFQHVESWDARAVAVTTDAEATGRRLADFLAAGEQAVAAYKRGNADSDNVVRARLAKTGAIMEPISRVMTTIAQKYGDLLERIDQTPNTKKEQSAMLRELRAEKKELQAQKKEVKASAAQIRLVARQQSAEAGQGQLLGWPVYMRGVAAVERRAIRRAKESALAPHENAAAALDRQILNGDRRIAWVQRFGEAADD